MGNEIINIIIKNIINDFIFFLEDLNFYENVNNRDILLVSPEKAKEIINAWIDFSTEE